MERVKSILAKKLGTSQKTMLLAGIRKLNVKNLLFIFTLGAVRTEIPELVISEHANPSQKATEKLELLK